MYTYGTYREFIQAEIQREMQRAVKRMNNELVEKVIAANPNEDMDESDLRELQYTAKRIDAYQELISNIPAFMPYYPPTLADFSSHNITPAEVDEYDLTNALQNCSGVVSVTVEHEGDIQETEKPDYDAAGVSI